MKLTFASKLSVAMACMYEGPMKVKPTATPLGSVPIPRGHFLTHCALADVAIFQNV